MSDATLSESNAHVSRRRFCAGACQVASGATLATLFTACGGSPTSPSSNISTLGIITGQFAGSGVRVAVAGSALTSEGGAALIESTAGVFLLARTSANAFTAVEAVCTHEGCTVTNTDGDQYVCPCHGSRYTRSGQVVHGPAMASLRRYTTSFTDGVVTIAI
ncbi:MAG TPA: Rieske (2Fe-2S) protein [Vicinamibacterales bacterium]|nr:Rieske (2Fe-2S) protein [Vicinamibacterales bacterium]